MADESEELGPIDYVVVEFPEDRLTGEGLPLLVDLVDRGLVRVLDLVFVRKQRDGSVLMLTGASSSSGLSLDLGMFEGASSGLLDRTDIEEAAAILEPGSSAGILIYENSWAAPFASAIRRGGGELVASGRIPAQDVLNALETVERVGSVPSA